MTLLADLTWPEYRDRIARGDVVLVPVGATEQHGPHLPLATDALIVAEITRRAALAVGTALVAPVLAYGARSQPGSGGGQTFPGTISLDATTLMAMLQDILRELVRHGCRKLGVVNGHYENRWFLTEAIDLAVREARQGGITDLTVLQLGYGTVVSQATLDAMFPEGFPGTELEHAARMETSILLHLFPDRVQLDRLPTDPLAAFPPWQLFPPERMPVPASGVLAPAEGATAEFGRLLVEAAVAELVAAVAALRQ